MEKYYQNGSERYKRITKKQAEKRFNTGVVCIFPCKLTPFEDSTWITKRPEESFEEVVKSFEFYNCNKAAGTHAAFCIKV